MARACPGGDALDLLEGGEDGDGGGFGERLVLQVEAGESVGRCCGDGLGGVAAAEVAIHV
jgi:hypothetical protein